MAIDDWRLAYIKTEDIDNYWGWLGNWLNRALERAPSDMTIDQIYEYATQDRLRLWLVLDGDVPEAVFVTGEQPDGTLDIFAMAGRRMTQWMPVLIEPFAQMAKASGMTRFRMAGRKGWLNVLKNIGYVQTGTDGDRILMERVL